MLSICSDKLKTAYQKFEISTSFGKAYKVRKDRC